MIKIFNSIKDKLYYLITGYMTKMGMIAWGGEIYNGPVPWDESTWGTGTFTGGSGDSPGVFVSLADQIAAAATAPSWLAPEDYVASGYTPEGISTAIAPSNPYESYSQAPAFLSPNEYFATGFSPSGENLYFKPSNKDLSQLSTNPDPKQAFNFVANPLVSDANPFGKPINNAIQAYLGRPANALELSQYSTILAKNPDDYSWVVNNIQNSPEAAKAILQNKQNLIIDPKKGDMTNMWLGADYALWKPSEESGFSKITNAIGGAIPFAALAAMTGGAGAAAGLGAIGAGALAGGVSNAARAAIEGGNIGTSALTGALTGALSGGALDYLSASPSLATGGIDLGSNFTWNLPSYEDIINAQIVNAIGNPSNLGPAYAPTAGANVTVTGAPSIYNDYGATNIPLVNANNPSLEQFGPSYADLGYTPQAGPSYAELGYSPSLFPSSVSGFNPLSSLSSLLTSLTGGPGTGPGTGPGNGTGGDGTGDGGDGTGDGGTGTGGGPGVGPGTGPGTGPGKVPTSPTFKFPTIPLPPPVIPKKLTDTSFYAPKGQVDYRPIIDLLGPRQILRNLF